MSAVKRDNQFIYGMKFIACLFVITIHAPFPGLFGGVIGCIAKFAVPFFFAVSGRYLLNGDNPDILSDAGGIRKRALRALRKLLKVTALVYVIYLSFSLLVHFLNGYTFIDWLSEKFNLFEARNFILFNSGRFIYDWSYTFDHMWYLFALIYVYALIYIFAPALRNLLKPLLVLLMGLLFFCELLQTYYPVRLFDISISTWYAVRNWLLVGIPFVLLGIWFGSYVSRKKMEADSSENGYFFDNFKNAAYISIILGIICSLAEQRLIGTKEVYFGSLFIVVGLLFLSETGFSERFPFSAPGKTASGNIYFYHVLILTLTDKACEYLNIYLWEWLRPCVIMTFSIILFYVLPGIISRKRDGKKIGE